MSLKRERCMFAGYVLAQIPSIMTVDRRDMAHSVSHFTVRNTWLQVVLSCLFLVVFAV